MIMVAKYAEDAQRRMQVPENLGAGLAVQGDAGARSTDERRRRDVVSSQNDQVGSQLVAKRYGGADNMICPGRVVVQIAQPGDS